MILDYVTSEEKNLIDSYRRYCGPTREQAIRSGSTFCSTDYWLREWAEQKQGLFEKIFHSEGLIYKEPISYQKSTQQIAEELENDYKLIYPLKGKFWNFVENTVFSYYHDIYHYYCDFPDDYQNLRYMMTDSELAKKFVEKPFTLPALGSDHKEVKVTKGMKITTALKKLYKEYGFWTDEEYQKFVDNYSTFFNQKNLHGTLCISIHPLDYITMSENDCGWESCMNWENFGCYRRGTVEMMNSSRVIVAYLESETPMNRYGVEWNSKKWRCLFIVDDDCIVSVKSYPYYNEFLDQKVIEIIMREGQLKFDTDLLSFEQSNTYHFEGDDYEGSYYFRTDKMYNDFGCGQPHWGCFNYKPGSHYINYSGATLCAWCGESEDTVSFVPCGDDYEAIIVCDDCCSGGRVCEKCGDYIYGEGYYTADGEVCEYCFEHYYTWCEYAQEYYHDDDLFEVYIAFEEGGYNNRYDCAIRLPEYMIDNLKEYFKDVYLSPYGDYYVKAWEVIKDPNCFLESDSFEWLTENCHNNIDFD